VAEGTRMGRVSRALAVVHGVVYATSATSILAARGWWLTAHGVADSRMVGVHAAWLSAVAFALLAGAVRGDLGGTRVLAIAAALGLVVANVTAMASGDPGPMLASDTAVQAALAVAWLATFAADDRRASG
jgi:hypothetical protein